MYVYAHTSYCETTWTQKDRYGILLYLLMSTSPCLTKDEMSMDDSDDDLGVDDNAIFSRILHSLGVTKYDPSVPTALADFARSESLFIAIKI